ncbi:hypothetical protein AB0F17_64775 [Nonomuraea sp. NPDC026600]|uniref:hypothetical protein n=1 Tax=Nonomuraea sp. NPDC026600 TaxID=3155363 RepID=UPI0033DE1FA1
MTHSDERAGHATPRAGETHNHVNGADSSVIQRGNLPDLGTDVDVDVVAEAVPPHASTVRNTVTGHVSGSVVQAGNVYGGLTIT